MILDQPGRRTNKGGNCDIIKGGGVVLWSQDIPSMDFLGSHGLVTPPVNEKIECGAFDPGTDTY